MNTRKRTTLSQASLITLLGILSACTSEPPTPDAAEVAQAAGTEQAGAQQTAQANAVAQAAEVAAESARVATGSVQTLTARPTSTQTPSPTFTRTPTPTRTPMPTNTETPAPTATDTAVPTATRPPATAAPTQPPAPVTMYGSTAGPAGYTTTIICFRGSGDCSTTMSPGDVNFTFTLGSDAATPWTLFLPYGLSVERDGVNIPEMFMFVDAGWLPPGITVQFGGSKNFAAPGRYIVRSSGCMLVTAFPCGWTTMGGTTVTFVIQP